MKDILRMVDEDGVVHSAPPLRSWEHEYDAFWYACDAKEIDLACEFDEMAAFIGATECPFRGLKITQEPLTCLACVARLPALLRKYLST
jgi:hypothetical protein